MSAPPGDLDRMLLELRLGLPVDQRKDRRLAMVWHGGTPATGRGLSGVLVGGRRQQDGQMRIGRCKDGALVGSDRGERR